MSEYVLEQLKFVRNQTINFVSKLNDQDAQIIPIGLNNNIKWNLGHIYVVQERFAFLQTGREVNMPESFESLFAPGTKPVNWGSDVPEMADLLKLLTEQMTRIETKLPIVLKEEVKQPYVTSKGLKLTTVEQFLSFCLYHEGMHFAAIKNILSLIKN